MLSCWCCGTRTRCCAGTPAGSGTSQRTGCGSPRWHGCSRAGAGPKSSLSRPRRCWPGPKGPSVTGQAGRPRCRRSQLSAGCRPMSCHRQLLADHRDAMGVQVGSLGVQVGFAGTRHQLPWLRSLATSDSSTHFCRSTTEGARQDSQAHYRSISALEHIEQHGAWGFKSPRQPEPADRHVRLSCHSSSADPEPFPRHGCASD
jgi:hypothetical protein